MKHAAHSVVSHAAQIHIVACLFFGGLMCSGGVFAFFKIIENVRRRSYRDLASRSFTAAGMGLIGSAYLRNAFIPLRPGSLSNFIVPTTDPIGIALFLGGAAVSIIGVFLTPAGKAAELKPEKTDEREERQTEENVWPPPPKRG